MLKVEEIAARDGIIAKDDRHRRGRPAAMIFEGDIAFTARDQDTQSKEEKRGFSAFRDLRDGKDQDRDDGRRRGGRERSIKPPGSKEPDG